MTQKMGDEDERSVYNRALAQTTKILPYVWLALVRFFQDDVLFKIWFFE